MKISASLGPLLALAAGFALVTPFTRAQPPPAASAAVAPVPNAFNSPEALAQRARNAELASADRKKMMDLLGVKEPANLPPRADDPKRPPNTRPLPAPSNNWTDDVPGHTIVRSSWGNWTNYDLAKADIGTLPDPLVLKNGQPVRDAATWWQKRRPEIVADFETEIYGKTPANTPKVRWEVTETDAKALDGTAVLKRITGHIDNARFPAATPSIALTLYTPANATGPVPVMVIIGGGGGRGGPNAPNPTRQQLLAKGWGYATFNPTSLQADSGAGLNVGIIGLVNEGRSRKPDDWGALAAWSWGLSRAIDYFETDKSVDAKRLGVEGHSRWGKTAVVAAAFEPRWAISFSSCSGAGGTKLHRHDIGESVDNVCGSTEYHWMAGNFLKYAGRWDALPIDQHELIALVAPRPIFVTGGTTDLWSDPVGEFKACVGAGPVYRLLGKKDVGQTEMPVPDQELISGDIGFRNHAGGHTDSLDWPTFLKFAERYFSTRAK